MSLNISDRQLADGRTMLAVSGEVDVYSGSELRASLTKLVAAGHHDLVVDLRGVTFMDSTGLGVLVGGLRAVRSQGGSLELVCTAERLLKVFVITGLSKVFRIHSDVPGTTS